MVYVHRYFYESMGALLKYCTAAFSASFLSNLMVLEPDSKGQLSLPQEKCGVALPHSVTTL
jgi:hypothetical protein